MASTKNLNNEARQLADTFAGFRIGEAAGSLTASGIGLLHAPRRRAA